MLSINLSLRQRKVFTRDSGKVTKRMEEDNCYIRMGHLFRVIGKMTNLSMDRNIGLMIIKYMKEHLKMVSIMDKAPCHQSIQHTWEILKMVYLMERVN